MKRETINEKYRIEMNKGQIEISKYIDNKSLLYNTNPKIYNSNEARSNRNDQILNTNPKIYNAND